MNFTLLRTFSNYMDAHILKGRLEAEGIHCWLKDEHLVSVMPMWDQAAGGIKLMVADIQWQQANKLLQAFEDEKRTNFRCPACNSSNIEYVSTYKKRINLLNAVMQALLFSYAMPAKAWRCFDCGNECKDPKETFPGHS